MAERRMVLDDENPQGHSAITVAAGAEGPAAGICIKKILWQSGLR